jgi:hypothetical protein
VHNVHASSVAAAATHYGQVAAHTALLTILLPIDVFGRPSPSAGRWAKTLAP